MTAFEAQPETVRGRMTYRLLQGVHDAVRSDLERVERLAAQALDGLSAGEVTKELDELKRNGMLWRLRLDCLRVGDCCAPPAGLRVIRSRDGSICGSPPGWAPPSTCSASSTTRLSSRTHPSTYRGSGAFALASRRCAALIRPIQSQKPVTKSSGKMK